MKSGASYGCDGWRQYAEAKDDIEYLISQLLRQDLTFNSKLKKAAACQNMLEEKIHAMCVSFLQENKRS